MGRYPHPSAVKFALMEKPQTGRQKADDRRRPMLRPGKFRCGAWLIVVFEKARELVLVVEAGKEMTPDRRGMPLSQPVIEPLVVAVVKALLLQSPFEVPINLGHECESRMFCMHR